MEIIEMTQSGQQVYGKKREYIKFLFGDDYDDQSGEIVKIPFMEHRCSRIIKARYLKKVPPSSYPRGTSLRDFIEIDKFLSLYEEIIDIEKSPEENLRAMIDFDESKNLGHAWYLRMHLEKVTATKEKPFVDLRPEFARLNEEYRNGTDHEAGLIAIEEALKAFV